MAAGTVRVKNQREFLRACARADKATRKEVREALKKVGEPVRRDAAAAFSAVDRKSAAGYRVVVRQRGVAVEQRYGRTTGQHPEFGRMQMTRALLPALAGNEDEIVRGMERALDEIADAFQW